MNLQTLLDTTKHLMTFQTTQDQPAELRACADFIEDFFAHTKLKIERFEQNGVHSLVVTKGTKTPKVFLNGHFDVVPGTQEQFTPYIKKDRLYGRGALDMKSGDAIFMHLMRELEDTPQDVGLMLTGDEEVGGWNGVGHLMTQGYSSEVVIIPDGGEAVHKIISKEKGILRIRLIAHGVCAHSSLLWQGTNAIERLLKTIPHILNQFLPISEHEKNHWHSTINLGMCAGGAAVNQVPDFAQAVFDIRFVEEDTPEEIIARIRRVLPKECEIEPEILAPLVIVPCEHPLVTPFVTALNTHGRNAEFVLDPGASDGRFFVEKGIPMLMSQPDGANLHAPNEWVHIPSMELYYNVVKEYLDLIF